MSTQCRSSSWSGVIAEPVSTRNEDGTSTLDWPENYPPVALIARELMVQLNDEHNEFVALVRAAAKMTTHEAKAWGGDIPIDHPIHAVNALIARAVTP